MRFLKVLDEKELDTEKNFRIFMGISAGIHVALLFSLMNLTLPLPLPSQLLEVSLMEIIKPSLPNPVQESPPQEEPKSFIPPIVEEVVQSNVQEQLAIPEDVQSVSSPSGSITQQTESSATSGGDSKFNEAIYAYLNMVKKKIEAGKKYPPDAFKKGEEGESRLKFTILNDGSVKDVIIIRSSGSQSLDEASVQLVKSSSPFLPPPGNRSLSIKVPINYKITH